MRSFFLQDFCIRIKNASSMGLVYVVCQFYSDLVSMVIFFQKEGIISYFVIITGYIIIYLKASRGIDLLGRLTLCSRGYYGFFIPFKKFLYLVRYNPNILFLYSGLGWDFFFFLKMLEFPANLCSGGLGGYVLSVNSRVAKFPK